MPKSTRERIIELLKKNSHTAKSLEGRLVVRGVESGTKSLRQIQRTLKALHDENLIIKEGNEFRVDKVENYLAPKQLLEFEEAIQEIKRSGQLEGVSKLEEVFAALTNTEEKTKFEQLNDSSWFFDASGSLSTNSKHAKTIQRAIKQNKSILINYQSSSEKEKEEYENKAVDPIRIVLRSENLYLLTSPKEGIFLTYRLDRIKGISIKGTARNDYSSFDIKKHYEYVWGALTPNDKKKYKPETIRITTENQWLKRRIEEKALYPEPKIKTIRSEAGVIQYEIELRIYNTSEFQNWYNGMKASCVDMITVS